MAIKGIKNLAKLDIRATIVKVLDDNPEAVKDVSREQLARGETPSGGKLPVYKNPRYVAKKPLTPKTAPGNRYNLRLKGDFYKGIKPKIAPNAILWPEAAQDDKLPFLQKWSDTKTLLVWNDESISRANQEFLIPKLQEQIVKEIFG